ncbi:MAG TPA: DUF3662 and FHA domain-containing protein [Candidatus Limnocylindrales bacterium]|nr:DUF3662 and FHA domain-containing protein [Candidatus Limnocylindrales bacterium]
MAGPLAAVERFFERLFERPAARIFQAHVEPVHIQRGLERAMESERRMVQRRTYAPNTYRVLLNTADYAALDGDRAALTRDLSESLRNFARGHGYVLLARPALEIEGSAAVQLGDVRVYAQPVVLPATSDRPAGIPRPQPVAPPPPVATDTNGVGPVDGLGQATAVFAAHSSSMPRAQLAIRVPNKSVERFQVHGGTVRLGRSQDNNVVLSDDRVSRHHGQIGVRLGMLVYTDLGSTNGSYLNGSPVTEIALGPGDVLQLGSSTVTIEPST